MKTKKTIVGLLIGMTLLSTTTLGVVSCTDMEDAASFVVTGVLAVTQQEQCMARADARRMRFRGILDTWMRNRYYLYPVLQSYLISTTDFGPLYGENYTIQVLGAHITFSYPANLDAATKALLSESYFTTGTGMVKPTSTGIAEVMIIPPEVGNALAAEPFTRATGFEIVAHVRIEGQLMDGTIVQTNEYQFPIDICWGCLYQVVTDDCSAFREAQDMKPPCRIGQDEGVDCRLFSMWGWGTP